MLIWFLAQQLLKIHQRCDFLFSVIALGTKSTSFFSLVVIVDASLATPKDHEIQTVDHQNYSMNEEDFVI
jgi:hypothetical protein